MKTFLIFTLSLSAAWSQGLTVNKYAYTLGGTPKAIDANNKIGPSTAFTYEVNIISSDSSQGTSVSVTDDLPPGFKLVSVLCTGSSSPAATCPGGLASETLNVSGDPITMSGFTIPTGGSIKLAITGYFEDTGNFRENKVEASRSATGPVSTGSHSINIDPVALPIDLEVVEKKVDPATGSLGVGSAVGTELEYTITVRNNGPADAYVGGLRLIDRIKTDALGNQVTYDYHTFACTGIACPTLPTSLNGTLYQFYNAAFTLQWPTGAVLKNGESFTLTFKAKYATSLTCGVSGAIKVTNEAFLALANNNFAISDTDSTNNSKSRFADLSYTLSACPPPAGIVDKKQLFPVPPTAAKWDDGVGAAEEVEYEITVRNDTANAISPFYIDDYLYALDSAPAFIATVSTPNCPSCDSYLDPNNAITFPRAVTVDGNGKLLFRAKILSLAAGQTVTLTFKVRFASTCAGSDQIPMIRNYALASPIGNDYVDTSMEKLTPCKLRVEKEQIDQNGQVILNGELVIGQPVRYRIRYINPAGEPTVILRNLRDTLAITIPGSGNHYGAIPIKYGATSCVLKQGAVVSPLPTPVAQGASTNIVFNSPASNGVIAINEPGSALLTFGGDPAKDTIVECNIEFTPGTPTGCQGIGEAYLTNLAYLDTAVFNQNSFPPYAYSKVDTKLPLCRTITVQKDPLPEQARPGDTVTYTITVINNNVNDPVADILVRDTIPSGFTFVSAACPACSGNPVLDANTGQIQATISSIPKGGQAVITIVVTAPSTGGTYENVATAEFTAQGNYFSPGGKLSDNAQVQVLTPKLSKAFKDPVLGPNQSTSLTWTITDQPGNTGQKGITFIDRLPAGLEIIGDPVVSCKAITATKSQNAQGEWVVTVKGDLLPREGTCTITVRVQTKSCGTFVNNKDRITEATFIDPTGVNASLEVKGCPPALTISKELTGAPRGYTGTFAFDVVCSTPAGQIIQKKVTIDWPNTRSVQIPDLPAGTTCTVAETKTLPPLPDGYDWNGVPLYSPAFGVIKITAGSGSANTVTIGNSMRPCEDRGEVKITKRLDGVPAGFRGTFTFTVNCWRGSQLFTKQAQITLPGSPTVSVTGMPSGSVCTVSENGPLPPLPAGWQWSAPSYSPANGQVNLAELCCQTVVVTNKAKYCCRVEPGKDYRSPTAVAEPARRRQQPRAQ